jgi:hypothetical protein
MLQKIRAFAGDAMREDVQHAEEHRAYLAKASIDGGRGIPDRLRCRISYGLNWLRHPILSVDLGCAWGSDALRPSQGG